MAAAKREASARHGIGQVLPLGALKDALNLAHRLREGETFSRYVRKRLRLVVPMGVLHVLTSIACASAIVVFLGGTQSLVLFLALLLMPFVLIGSLFVQAYVFFSWLEDRALLRAYGKRTRPAELPMARWMRKTLRADMGKLPPVPWGMAIAFVLVPMAMLAAVAAKAALALIALHVLGPVLYGRLDR